VVAPDMVVAELMSGLFCKLFAAKSVSPGSLGLETSVSKPSPEPLRSMPSPPLEKMELREISSPVALSSTSTPSRPLKAIAFDPPAVPSPSRLARAPL